MGQNCSGNISDFIKVLSPAKALLKLNHSPWINTEQNSIDRKFPRNVNKLINCYWLQI